EVLVVEQWVRAGVAHVAHENRLTALRDAPGDALAESDARAVEYVRRDAARRGEVDLSRLGRAQHERAPLRLHVVADEREQAVDELARVVRRRVERQYAVDEIERARRLPQRLAAAVQLQLR